MGAVLSIRIVSDASRASKDMDRTAARAEKMTRAINQGAKVAAAGFVALGAGAVKLAQGAADDEAAQARLAQQLKNTTGATRAQVAAVEDWITKQGKLTGITDDQLRPAMAKLTTATGSVSKAQRLALLAQNISIGTGKSYESVVQSLAKAQTGSVTGLSKFGVATKNAAGETKSLAQIQDELAAKFKGQAAKQAQTAAGKMQIFKTQMAEAGETIGAVFLPVLTRFADYLTTKVLPAVQSTFDYVSQHKETFKVLAIAVGAVGAAFILAAGFLKAYTIATTIYAGASKAVAAAQKAWAAAQWLLNVAMSANPIGLVVIAIVALVAAIVIAWKRSETFRKIVTGAFAAVSAAAGRVKDWVVRKFGEMLAFVRSLPGKVRAGTSRIWSVITDKATEAKRWAEDKLGSLVGFVRGLPGKVASAASGMWDGIKDAFRSALNWVIDKWNGLEFKLPSISAFGKTVGGGSFRVPQIPRFAEGGIVTGPTLAVLGDNKRGTEAVIPIEKWPELLAGLMPDMMRLHPDTIVALAEAILAGAARVSRGVVANEARGLVVGVGG